MTSSFEITFNAYNYLLSFFSTKNTFPKNPFPNTLSTSNEETLTFYPIIISVLSIFSYIS